MASLVEITKTLLLDEVPEIKKTKEVTMATEQEHGYGYHGYGHGCLDETIANGVNNIRHEQGMGFCDVNKTVLQTGSVTTQQLANVERDLQNRIHEGMRQTQTSSADLSRYLSDKGDALKDKLAAFVASTAENFCAVRTEVKDSERRILDRLSADKLDEKNSIIEELRTKHSDHLSHSNIALQNQELSYLKQMINSVEQTQRFGSKTVQFGTGNTAGTAQTANQG